MDYTELKKDNTFQTWHEYEPFDTQYARYYKNNPEIIACGHKIADVYRTFSDARASFMFADGRDYGDCCANNDVSKLYMKSLFLKNAILEYAVCLDLSWQVIWYYTQPKTAEHLLKNGYTLSEELCNATAIYSKFAELISTNDKHAKQLKKIMSKFQNKSEVIALRKVYNTMKHRGTISIKGLEYNNKTMMGFVKVKTLDRPEFSFDELESMLFSYHKLFIPYFESIISEIMPPLVDYRNNKMDFVDYFNATNDMNRIQNS